jgi:hypothetical protein
LTGFGRSKIVFEYPNCQLSIFSLSSDVISS